MFCASCGAEVTKDLSYCNRCGANLKPLAVPTGVAPTKLVGAAWAISIAVTVVTLAGFGMVFGVVMTLIERGINLSPGGMALVFFALFFIFMIVALLIRQLARVLSLPQLPVETAPAQSPRIVESAVPEIAAGRTPVSSVTDHTTRTLEPVYRERDTQRS
ncbi:MAG TPA: zinc ribbon domain-containing protein [Pyrinomonadaceae bacterium]|nr:zinc ribbon domain-containing protein [Pyrinomonadaceae bacterium]